VHLLWLLRIVSARFSLLTSLLIYPVVYVVMQAYSLDMTSALQHVHNGDFPAIELQSGGSLLLRF
jgi:hypothetical protein